MGSSRPVSLTGTRLRWDPTCTALDSLAPESIAAVVVPGSDDLKYEPDEARMRFSGAGPKDAAKTYASALELVRRVDRAGAAIVVLPELCLDAAGAGKLAHWIEKEATHVMIAVCGSHHRCGDAGWDNIAIVAQGGRQEARLEQPKVRPFTLRENGRELVEDIERAGRCLTLLSGRYVSVLPLVCIDFIDKELRRGCEDLQPALVLVAACSRTMGVFETQAQVLAMHSQAHVVIANQDVGGPDEAMAVMARPRRTAEGCCEVHRPAQGPAPGAWITPLAAPIADGRWRPVPARDA